MSSTVAIRLPSSMAVGAGQHRSGWPYALESLRPIISPSGLLFDDFVERTFCYGPPGEWREPWIGVFHHPPGMPAFSCQTPQELFRLPEFRRSLPHLVRAVALSEYLARWLREELQVPVDVIRHPTDVNAPRWSVEAWRSGPRALVQIGWYLRNVRAIHQVPPVFGVRRCRLLLRGNALDSWETTVSNYWRIHGGRREYPGVTVLPRVRDAGYDRLLASCAVLAEFFDASANNLVLECLVRGTPLVCNRHPGVVEHLGEDYPLYFDRIDDVPRLLTEDRLVAAHHALASRDLTPFTGEAFLQRVRHTVAQATGSSQHVRSTGENRRGSHHATACA